MQFPFYICIRKLQTHIIAKPKKKRFLKMIENPGVKAGIFV